MDETIIKEKSKIKILIIILIIIGVSLAVWSYFSLFSFLKKENIKIPVQTPITAEQIRQQLNNLEANQSGAPKLTVKDIQKQLDALAVSTKNKSTVSVDDIRKQLDALNTK